MGYTFEKNLIQSKLKSGEITQREKEYDDTAEILDREHEKMWNRLDGTYQINADSLSGQKDNE